MKTQEEIVVALKSQIEVNQFGMIRSLMKRKSNRHFFADRVKQPDNGYFDFSDHTATWSDNYKILPYQNREGDDFFEVFINLNLSGKICEHNSNDIKIFQESISLDLGIRAYTSLDGWTNMENIYLLNDEQSSLTHFHRIYMGELHRTGTKTIVETEYLGREAYSFFTQVWKNVDLKNQKMLDGTSLDYFHEFVEAHRNVVFQVSCANMWGRYTTHYSEHAYPTESAQVYPHNPSFYDTRYTIFMETAMEDLYTFYERCAYFTYLFLQPPNLKSEALSYAKLFDKRTTKSLKIIRPDLASNPNWLWFTSRIKNEHKTLSGFRHPLIHYQDSNSFIRGSYGATLTRLWLKNAYDDASGLEELTRKMDEILKFLNDELPKCHDAFLNVVQLCEFLIPVPAPKLNVFQHLEKIFGGCLEFAGRRLIKWGNGYNN